MTRHRDTDNAGRVPGWAQAELASLDDDRDRACYLLGYLTATDRAVNQDADPSDLLDWAEELRATYRAGVGR